MITSIHKLKIKLPEEINNIRRVERMKILGVTLENKLTVKSHVSNILCSCAQSLHALRVLKSRGLPQVSLHDIYNSVIISKLTYAAPAWWGLKTAEERHRIETFVRKSKRYNYCSQDTHAITEICDNMNSKLFSSVTKNNHHVLHNLLPNSKTHTYNLRPRTHNYSIQRRTQIDSKNFIKRMILKDTY
jgi:hypothetical protein